MKVHPKLDAMILEAAQLAVQGVNTRSGVPARRDELVATRLSRRRDHFPYE